MKPALFQVNCFEDPTRCRCCCGDALFSHPHRYAVDRAALTGPAWFHTTMESSSDSQQEPEKSLVSR